MQMTIRCRATRPLVCAGAVLIFTAAGYSQPRKIDPEKSVMTVRAFKSGMLGAFGHDHEIAAPVAAGTVDVTAHRVQLRVNANAMRVRDQEGSEKDHAEIQKTMLGPEVLDAAKYSEIAFKSTTAESAGEGAWTVHGTLTLHGESRPVTVQVREKGGHFVGSANLKQTEFGIKPVKVAGGTVKVKDEVRVDFDIQLEEKGGKLP
jgi:polyisoprenoid-binding protein YceI